MPSVLWRVFHDNRSLADALPALAAGAISAFMTAKHGLQPGVIAILHTFTGKLEFNSHVHTMVTAGGWRVSSASWVNRVFYDCGILTRLWRRAVLDLLRTALRSGVLTTALTSDEMEMMLDEQERWWSIKIQSIDSVEHFFQYGGRYVRRPPIAQYRITHIGERIVQFWSKDKKSAGIVNIRCSLAEFIDRLAQHILKHYQHAVRYFGLFAPRAVGQMFDRIFAAIGHRRRLRSAPPRWAECRKQLSGQDPLLDRTGQRMHWVGRLAPAS
jgi:Putative transposase